MEEKKNNLRYLGFAISVIFHAALLKSALPKGFFRFNSQSLAQVRPQKKLIKISLNQIELLKKMSERKVHKSVQTVSKQIVNTELTGKNEKSNNTRFLGEKDQSFDRQTIARQVDSFKEAGLGKRNGSESKSLQKTVASTPKTKEEISFDKLGIGQIDRKIASEANKREMESTADSSTNSEVLGLENGKAGKKGLAQNNDYINDVALGDVTNLNTAEFKYFGFYHRIRQKLEQFWGRSIREKAKSLYGRGRRMPASEDLITALSVEIDERGNITKVVLEGSSGVSELDEAAVESFNKAGPFPNPPKELVSRGKATIQWGFVVKS